MTRSRDIPGADQNGDWFASELTAREHACIELRIPACGKPWLDALIAQAERRDLAAKAMQGFCANATEQCFKVTSDIIATWADSAADALITELRKEKP